MEIPLSLLGIFCWNNLSFALLGIIEVWFTGYNLIIEGAGVLSTLLGVGF